MPRATRAAPCSGAYPCKIIPGTRAFEAYGKELVEERHRHRYEFNNAFKDLLEEKGMVFSGTAPDGSLMEIVELPDHPWFPGRQFDHSFPPSGSERQTPSSVASMYMSVILRTE